MMATQVNLPKDIYGQARELAKGEGRSYSNFMRRLLEQRIARDGEPTVIHVNRQFEDARLADKLELQGE